MLVICTEVVHTALLQMEIHLWLHISRSAGQISGSLPPEALDFSLH